MVFKKILNNFKLKCEFCKKPVKRKSAYFEKVKRLEFVHPIKTSFCSEKCAQNYKDYEMNVPKKPSLCPACPVHPETIK